jgi:hypothetical protein
MLFPIEAGAFIHCVRHCLFVRCAGKISLGRLLLSSSSLHLGLHLTCATANFKLAGVPPKRNGQPAKYPEYFADRPLVSLQCLASFRRRPSRAI